MVRSGMSPTPTPRASRPPCGAWGRWGLPGRCESLGADREGCNSLPSYLLLSLLAGHCDVSIYPPWQDFLLSHFKVGARQHELKLLKCEPK